MTPKELTIAINGSMLDDHPTGVGVYTINIINNLSRLYHDNKSRKLTVFTAARQLLDDDIETISISSFVKSSTYGKFAALSRFLWNTFLYPVKVKKFDLLISLTTHGSLFTKNQILTIHDLISLKYDNISLHQRFYFKYLLPHMVKRAKMILTVSESSKKDIVHYLKCPENKVQIIYNGYNEAVYNYASERTDFIKTNYNVSNYLLAIGPTYPHKNFETLIKAYNSLDDSTRIKHPLVIAGGKKKYLKTLKALVSKLNLEVNVRFIGYVPNELMPSLYQEASLLIFPSLYEGFGIPLVEAMACGCPVIASNASSIPEVCGDAAKYFDALDKTALKKLIEELMNDQVTYQECVQKGLSQVKKFTWQQSAENLKDIIENNSIKSLSHV